MVIRSMLFLIPLFALAVVAVRQPRSRTRGDSSSDSCKAGVCGGMANYAVAPGMVFYSTFNVPGLPKNASAIKNDITFFIYQNIFFDGGPGQCKDCRMNQLCVGAPPASARPLPRPRNRSRPSAHAAGLHGDIPGRPPSAAEPGCLGRLPEPEVHQPRLPGAFVGWNRSCLADLLH